MNEWKSEDDGLHRNYSTAQKISQNNKKLETRGELLSLKDQRETIS